MTWPRFGLLSLLLVSSLALAQEPAGRVVAGSAAGAPGRSCNVCLTFYQKPRGKDAMEEGIRVGRLFVPCRVVFTDSNYTLRLGKPESAHFPRLSAPCGNSPGKHPFNRKVNGQRAGVWFKRYPWGALRKATMYQAGKPLRVVYYRPNGYFVRYLRYGPNSYRLSQYDKKGQVIGALPKF